MFYEMVHILRKKFILNFILPERMISGMAVDDWVRWCDGDDVMSDVWLFEISFEVESLPMPAPSMISLMPPLFTPFNSTPSSGDDDPNIFLRLS
jgi:hypothetical protein